MRPACGTCTHWMRYNGESRGPCLLNPPVVFASGEQRRPVVKENDPACSHHQAGEQAVKEKAQVPTHGAVVQAAREATRVDVPGVQQPPPAPPAAMPATPPTPARGAKAAVPSTPARSRR